MADVALSSKVTADPASDDSLIGVDVSVPNGIRRFPLSSDWRLGRVGIGVDPLHRIHMVSTGASEKDLHISHTLANGTGLAATYRPVDVDAFYTATDLAAGTLAWAGIRSGVTFGHNAAAAVGTVHSFTAGMFVTGAGDALNEYTPTLAVLRFDIGTGFTQTIPPTGRGWLADFNVHGPVAAQPDMLNGITMFYNNYYNGSPADSPAGGIWLVTRKASGGGKTSTHAAADTYPIDVGLGIVGESDVGAVAGIGWTKAIQIGGFGSGWKESGSSRIGTAIDISDFLNFGIKITRHASGTGPPIAIASGSGPIVVGADSAQFTTTRLEAVAPGDAILDPLAYFGSTGGSFTYTMQLRNGQGIMRMFISGAPNNILTGTIAGDVGIAIGSAGKSIHLGGSSKIVTVTNANTLGFFGVTPAAQQAGGVATAGATYTATEQDMIQKAYDCLRAFGLLN